MSSPEEERAFERFFETEKCPEWLEETERRMHKFVVDRQLQEGPIVLATSGGTKVPLETNTVRFIDNFSSGTRGAASVEEFLRAGCSVIMIRRRGSVVPFLRHVLGAAGGQDSDGFGTLRHLRELECCSDRPGGCCDVKNSMGFDLAPGAATDRARSALRDFWDAERSGRLMSVEFETLVEYLFLLRAGAVALRAAGRRALVYLAAAVSDFFVPASSMAVHKIQSADGPLQLELQRTPKVLGLIKTRWAPRSFCVSFKLETDHSILEAKARDALRRYHVDAVVANELHSRNNVVHIYCADGTVHDTRRPADAPELEPRLIGTVLRLQVTHAAAHVDHDVPAD